MDTRQLQYLDAMGIQVWEPRITAVSAVCAAAESAVPVEEPPLAAAAPALEHGGTPTGAEFVAEDTAPLDWDTLQQRVRECSRCAELASSRTQTVFGVGNRTAQVLVIGEAPGADEDAQGEPFVGRAGQLLNAMLLAIGFRRDEVYIANILKCRPPGNRDPKTEEAANCAAFLRRQIELIQPRLILVVGRIAAQSLLNTETPIGKLRGTLHHLGETPLVVTYHPAYLLRSPEEKRKSWDDLRLVLRTLRQGHAA